MDSCVLDLDDLTRVLRVVLWLKGEGCRSWSNASLIASFLGGEVSPGLKIESVVGAR